MIEHLFSHLLGWLLDRRLEREALSLEGCERGPETWTLQHSRTFRIFWTLMAVFWAAPIILVFVAGAVEGWVWPLPFIGLFFAVVFAYSLRLAWDAFRLRFEVSPRGIVECRHGRRATELAWSEITAVRYLWWLESYVLDGPRRRIRVSKHLRGLPRFKAFARSHIPPAAFTRASGRIADLTRP